MRNTTEEISLAELETVGQAAKISAPRPSLTRWPGYVWFFIERPIRTSDGRLYRAAQSNIVRDNEEEKLQWYLFGRVQ